MRARDMSVKTNYSKKTITCEGCFFWPKNVVFKIIGPYEYWKQLYEQFLRDPSQITFLSLNLSSRTRQSDFEELKLYAADDQDSFSWDFYSQFIDVVWPYNPLNPIRRRNTTQHSMSKSDFNKMTKEGRWLYVFFQYWKNRPKKEHPQELKVFCSRHNIKFNCDSIIAAIVCDSLAAIYDNENLISDHESFYHNHIIKDISPLKIIMERYLRGIPFRYPLNYLLQK